MPAYAASTTALVAVLAELSRQVGILDGCLRHHKKYDEQIAWPTPTAAAA